MWLPPQGSALPEDGCSGADWEGGTSQEEPRSNGIGRSGEVHTMPDPDAVTPLGLGELLLCSAGMAPAPCFSPLSGAAQTSQEELWSWGWTSSALTAPISGCLEAKKI